jgi:hypothetical protein
MNKQPFWTETRRLNIITFLMVVMMVSNLIVAIGNWHLYPRVARLETMVARLAMPQSPQKPPQQ